MSSVFLKRGVNFTVSSRAAMDLYESLPAATYVVKQNPLTKEFYLEQIADFASPSKVYGDTMRYTERILRTYQDRTVSTGVMLAGEKGSGKSLLAKMVSLTGIARNIPTVVINSPFCGDEFNSFMQNITQECIVLFDEFEKIYDRSDQEEILTLLDGVFPTKKLFVITCNDKWRIDSHMRNRPGRIFYMIEFDGLDQEFVREYCTDNLEDKSQVDAVCRLAALYAQFNFDMLKALVEDMNRYGETPADAIKLLNAKPDQSSNTYYRVVELAANGRVLNNDELRVLERIELNPLANRFALEYRISDGEGDYDWHSVAFEPHDISNVNQSNGTLEFKNENGDRALIVRAAKKEINWAAF